MEKKNIVLIHGWGASSNKFDELKQFLTKEDWSVYNIKLPGFDEPAPESAWTLDDYCSYVYKNAKKYFKNNNFYIFGHSFGGRIAIKCAYHKYPLLNGIILCSSSGLSRGNVLKRKSLKILAVIGKGLTKGNSNISKRWKILLYKLAREHDYEKTQGTMKDTFNNIILEDLKPYIEHICLPTLILWGESDRMTPFKDALFIKRNLKNSTIFSWKEEGHRLPYNKAKEIAEKISLWKRSLSR